VVAERATGTLRWALIGLLGIGIALRVIQYASNRSYYIDEAALLNSIASRSLADLLVLPLLHGQTAAPGFLALTRAFYLQFGDGELSMRAVSLLAGIGAAVGFRINRITPSST
jgi:hypothetical protein